MLAERAEPLRKLGAAGWHTWLSLEPLLGPVDIEPYLQPAGIRGVVAGCESGVHRRPAPHDWFRRIRDDCLRAGVSFFLKQMAENEDGTGKVLKLPELDGVRHDALAW